MAHLSSVALKLRCIRAIMEKIEKAMAVSASLPIPATTPTPDADTLPRPADAPTHEVDKLPRPTDDLTR